MGYGPHVLWPTVTWPLWPLFCFPPWGFAVPSTLQSKVQSKARVKWLFSLPGILFLQIPVSPLLSYFSKCVSIPSYVNWMSSDFSRRPAVCSKWHLSRTPFALLPFLSKALSSYSRSTAFGKRLHTYILLYLLVLEHKLCEGRDFCSCSSPSFLCAWARAWY